MKKILCGLLVAGVCVMAGIARGSVIYVNQNNAGPGDGLTWATAFTNVQAGNSAAVAGDQVWVARGLYKEQLSPRLGVALYGGFNGSETSLEERNWKTNYSILDGNRVGTVVAIPGGFGNTTRIDGFTIQNGSGANGGGIYCGASATPVIANNRIIQNEGRSISGGGIVCDSSSPQITNNVILGNRGWTGGGIHVKGSSNPSIRNNRIIGNSCSGSSPKGAGIMCDSSAAPQIINNVISGNYLGEFSSGGGIYCSGGTNLTIINNTLLGNLAVDGGGIFVQGGTPTVGNNIIAYNSSGIGSAGNPFGPQMRNNCLFQNVTTNFSGISNPIGTNGNISVNPMLTGTNTFLDVHLKAGSPCIDAGTNSLLQASWVDIDGNARSIGTAVDIGADEWDGTAYPESPRIVRISPNGSDLNDGSSWSLAKQTVRGAIGEAAEGLEVWAAAGVYNETNNVLPIFTYLYGGFNGTETSRLERNWNTNVTILDGGAAGGVLSMVYIGNGGSVDGFTIRNGKSLSGGGIYCAYASPLIANNTITGNVCTNINFSSDRSFGGGGVSFRSSGALLSNNVISANSAALGGGVFCIGSPAPTIANNLIRSNSANNVTGNPGYPPAGGGIYSAGNSPTIINNFVSGNIATNKSNTIMLGGGIFCTGGAPFIANNTVMRNLAILPFVQNARGGGIHCDSALAKVVNNIVAFNSSGMYLTNGITVRNNCVAENRQYNYSNIADPTGVDGNISVDPKFGLYGSVHLMADSPCRNAGDNSVAQNGWRDLDGSPRIVEGTVDIGADEFDGTIYPSAGAVIRVSTSGNDANDGSSWNLAKRTMRGAINAASNGDGGEIWVQSGTYQELVDIPTFVYLCGGFNGTETNRNQSNWATNLTVLDANNGGSAVTMTGLGAWCAISGFTIQNGLGSNGNGTISIPSPCKGTVANNRIIYNLGSNIQAAASCGIYVAGQPKIINNIIAFNRNMRLSPSLMAGGIYCSANSAPLIANNTIVNNSINGANGVGYGIGGIFSSDASPVIVNNIVAFNQGGISVTGGSPVLRNNCVFGNGTSNYVGVVPGLGDISVDPQLGDLGLNYALLAGSPCIDAGDGSVVESDWMDMYGRSRVAGATIDIGAYESSTVAEWLPLMQWPSVNIVTVGGISYLQYSKVFTNDGFRTAFIGPVVKTGTNFSQDFRFEWFTGPTAPTSNLVSGTVVLGVLTPGKYSLTTTLWGGLSDTAAFTLPSNPEPTLTGVSANGSSGFEMNVAGIADVDYIVQASTNLTDWISVHTNHGGPFVFTDESATNSPIRFYRVEVVK